MDAILIALIPLFYFLSSLLDSMVNRNVHGYIFLVNLVLGWTVLYWLVCFYWVFRDFIRRRGRKYAPDRVTKIGNPHGRYLSRAGTHRQASEQAMTTDIDSAEHRIRGTMGAVLDRLMQTIDELNNTYLELSKVNLNPDSTFYNVTQPPIMTIERPLRPKKLMAYAILAWILAEGAIIFAILIANIYGKPRVTGGRKATGPT